MNFRKSIFLFFILIFQFSGAQERKIFAFDIPKNIKEKANAVVRNDSTYINVNADDNMVIQRYKLITVFNKIGNRYSNFTESYDDYYKINDIEINIYNAFGKRIKKVKKSEIKDFSSSDGFSLYNDDRILHYEYIPQDYPYTIEMSYQIKTSNTAFIPGYYPIEDYYVGVEKSSYTLTHDASLKINVFEQDIDQFDIQKEINENTYKYRLENRPSIRKEPFSPSLSEMIPLVLFASNEFSLAGTKGKANNWLELGDWMQNKLLENRDELPQKTKDDVLALVNGVEDDVEKAKLIYKYMQDRTRYISVQIGIGGWKPMLAKDVDEKGYGDCKALVNYTKALLDVAEVPSLYTVVYADKKKNINKDIVKIQGNHVILCLPTKKDTLWLECTSQKSPFSHIGSFTDDRDVFIVNKGNSKIIRTKKYLDEENLEETKGKIQFKEDGSLETELTITSYGKIYDDKYQIESYDDQEKEDHYKELFPDMLSLKLKDITLENDKKKIQFKEHIKFTAANYIKKLDGNDYIIRPNVVGVWDYIPPRVINREHPLKISTGFLDKSEIEIVLPSMYDFSFVPEDKELISKFGTYTIKYIKKSGKELILKRTLLVKEGSYAKEEYKEFVSFLKKVNKQDKLKAIIKKQT